MKKIILSTVLTTAALSMGTAFAGGGNLFGGSNESSMSEGAFYGGGSIGQAKYRCIMDEDEDCENDGWKVFAGYKVNENIAIEGGYYNLGDDDGDYTHDTYGEVSATAEASGIGVAGLYTQPVADNLEVFGKLGAMFWTVDGEVTSKTTGKEVSDDKDGTSVLIGLGASYQFNDNWGIRGEWERYTAEYENIYEGEDTEENIDILSAGVTFSTY